MAKQYYIACNEDTWQSLLRLAKRTNSQPERGPKAGSGEASVMTLVRRMAENEEVLRAIEETLTMKRQKTLRRGPHDN